MPETLIQQETFECGRCDRVFPIDERTELGDEVLCDNCRDEYTCICDSCNDRIWTDEAEGDDDRNLCSDCYNEHYCRCTECNQLLHKDNAYYINDNLDEPFCRECYDDNNNEDELNFIHNYSYKPYPIFHGKGIYYGLELELDCGGMIDSNAETLLQIANTHNENLYIKQDGSLNDGFELVTHPMSLEYHISSMPWLEILNTSLQLGYKSHMAKTCGLHIHVSRAALGDGHDTQEVTISNILYMIEKHWDQMLRFSRRTQEQINRWASRYGFKDNPKELLEHAKNTNIGRYACVNLANESTIEFRIFRGTLKYSTLIATLQLVDEICSVAISLSQEEIQALSWQDFVLMIDAKNKPELIAYLKYRRLYVNEPVVDEQEDV